MTQQTVKDISTRPGPSLGILTSISAFFALLLWPIYRDCLLLVVASFCYLVFCRWFEAL